MYSDPVIWGRCPGSLTSVRRFTIGAHDSVGTVWGSRRCIRSAEPAMTSRELGPGWRVGGYSTRHVPGKETKFCRLNRALGRFGDGGRRTHVSCQKGSRTFCVREPARRVITRKYRSSHAGVEDEEGLLMPPGGSVGPADRATPGRHLALQHRTSLRDPIRGPRPRVAPAALGLRDSPPDREAGPKVPAKGTPAGVLEDPLRSSKQLLIVHFLFPEGP
jgi:hypothetical protein